MVVGDGEVDVRMMMRKVVAMVVVMVLESIGWWGGDRKSVV